jgi:predicted nucleic acid-binding protein
VARIFWDTNLFIYLFEKNAEWSPHVIELRRRMLARGDELLTSYLTVGEVITKPKQLNNAMLERS